MSPVVQQDYRLLKTVVVAMGVILLVMLAVVVATLIKRAGKKPLSAQSAVTLPAGSHITQTQIGEGSIVLHLDGDAGASLIILDARTGRETGRVKLVSPDAAQDQR